MHKVAELDITILINSKYFHDLILLFHDTLANINEKETNNELVLFFSFLISSSKGSALVQKYIEPITAGLICAIPKESGQLLEKIANALVTLMHASENSGFET